jgi:hypothetical protein
MAEFGGLIVLGLLTFLQPTALPEDFAKVLTGLQVLFGLAALALAAKYAAEIKDVVESKPAPPA